MYLARKYYFTSLIGEETTILRGHPSHAKVLQLQGKCSTFISQSFLRVLVQPQESNPRPPAQQSSALPTELILPWFI